MSPDRNINLDALRCFALFGVVTLHVLGGAETLYLNAENQLIVNMLLAISYCSVNIFGLLSGYLKVDRQQHCSAIIKILAVTIFWCFLIAIICAIFFSEGALLSIIKNAFPFITDRLWYITCYIFVFACAPFMNQLAASFSRDNYRRLLTVLFILMSLITTIALKDVFHVVSHGYSAGWLIYMYLLGGYFKLYGFPEKLTKSKAAIWLVASLCIIVASRYVLDIIIFKIGVSGNNSLLLYYYNSPLTLLNSILFMYIFISSRSLNGVIGKIAIWISNVSLGVYIIHAHPYMLDTVLVGENLGWMVNDNCILTFLLISITMIAIVIFAGVLEQGRMVLFRKLKVDILCKTIGDKIDTYLTHH